jgi:hypothetical protein
MLKALLATACAGVMLMGCANQRFNVGGETPAATSAKLTDSQTFWVDGIGQNTTVDAAQVCGGANKVVAVEVEQTGANVLLGIVTLGIYTPRTARVHCK